MGTQQESSQVDVDVSTPRRRWHRRILSTSFGTASVYLKKPILPPISEYSNLFLRRNPHVREGDGDREGVVEHVNRENSDALDPSPRGSEVKVLRRMRIWEKGNLKPCPIDFGVGVCATLDPEVKFEPVARVRIADAVTLKFLPERVVKFSKKLPFHFQGMQAHLRYEVPLLDLKNSWWKPPARMLIRFEHGSNSGFHFYPGGLEFGDHTIPLTEDNKAALRFAAGLSFPREFPMHANHPPVWEVYRLGLKTVW